MKKIYHQFKCSAIMLPEHRTMLKNQNESEKAQKTEPSLSPDEQKLEEFDRHINSSLKMKEEVHLYLKGNGNSTSKLKGVVKESEPAYSYLRILSEGVSVKVYKKDILKIEKNN